MCPLLKVALKAQAVSEPVMPFGLMAQEYLGNTAITFKMYLMLSMYLENCCTSAKSDCHCASVSSRVILFLFKCLLTALFKM